MLLVHSSFRPSLLLQISVPLFPQAHLVEMQLSTLHEDWESVVALTGKVLKAQPHHLEAMVLRGRAYFYLNGER